METKLNKLLAALVILSAFLVGCVEDPRANAEDKNGNEYPVTIVGGQKWIAANLKNSTGGNSFTWQEAQNACPEGWRLPKASAWRTLFAGVSETAYINDVKNGLAYSGFAGQDFDGLYWALGDYYEGEALLISSDLITTDAEDGASANIRCIKSDSDILETPFTITAQELNVRKAPSKKAGVEVLVYQGDEVAVCDFGEEGTDGISWNRIRIIREGERGEIYSEGYASAKYMTPRKTYGYVKKYEFSWDKLEDWQKYLIYALLIISLILYIIALYKSGSGQFFIFAGSGGVALTTISFIMMIGIPLIWGLNETWPMVFFVIGALMEVGNLVWTAIVNEGVFNKILAIYAQLYTVILVIIVLIIVAIIFCLYILAAFLASSQKKEISLGNGLFAVFTKNSDGGWSFSNFVRH